jgi:hypothetical protein
MPRFDARSMHHIEIDAAPERVYEALLSTDFGRNPVLRTLMMLRAIPAIVFTPRATYADRGSQTARNLLSGAFRQLEATPPVELVLGLTGRFWTPAGGLIPTDGATFRDPIPAGVARATWGFRVEPTSPGRSRLTTETRVLCADDATRRQFLRYWRVIRGGSGIIRWALLRQIKSVAEASTTSLSVARDRA